jgi:3',5'-cyclic AMP phosphodiesterase CpdA
LQSRLVRGFERIIDLFRPNGKSARMARLYLLSDLHLSDTHGFFWANFCRARDAANAAEADLVVVTGDLCINGPESDAEMALAGRALSRLRAPWRALPGNHDVGDEPPGQDPDQIINAQRLARWNAVFGADHFATTVGAWRVIGVNAQLLGSGLAEEAAQDAWLDAELQAAAAPVVLILHKPLFLLSADETAVGATTINPEPRHRLLRRLAAADVRLIVSGHLHAWRDREIGDLRHIWLPATSFIHANSAGGVPMAGTVSLDLSSEVPVVTLHHPEGLETIDLAELKQHGRYKFLRDMPPCPPDETD